MTLSVFWSELGPRSNDSPLRTFSGTGGSNLTRKYRVRWADADLAGQQLVGYSFVATVNGRRRLRRELPEGYVFDRTMYCTDASVERGETWTGRSAYDFNSGALLPGYPNNNRTKDTDGNPTDSLHKRNEYKWAVLRASFRQADFAILNDQAIDQDYDGLEYGRFVSYRSDREAKGVTVPGGKLYFVTPQKPLEDPNDWNARRLVPFQVGKLEVKSTITLTWRQVAIEAIPSDTIDSMIGKVNKLDFQGHAKGTLLFMGTKLNRYVMANGSIGADVDFLMSQFKTGQLKLLTIDKDTGKFMYQFVTPDKTVATDPDITTLPDGKYLFDGDDFSKLFDPNNP